MVASSSAFVYVALNPLAINFLAFLHGLLCCWPPHWFLS